MKKSVRILLILIALVCFGVALYYPISEYVMQKQSVNTMDKLAALRNAGLEAAETLATEAPEADEPEKEPETTEAPAENEVTAEPAAQETPEQAGSEGNEQPAQTEEARTTALSAATDQAIVPVTTTAPTAGQVQSVSATAETGTAVTEKPATTSASTEKPVSASAGTEKPVSATETAEAADGEPTPSPSPTAKPTPSPTPTATPDRHVSTGPKIWSEVEKVALDESRILPQYRELYAINHEMVGWMTISGTKIDYPVMQTEDENYYLSHDFFHDSNANGLLILDHNCDAFTPSYNMVVSGHNRKNDTIFSKLTEYYQDKRHRDAHKLIQFDSLMEERTYIVFAAFFAADYDVDEEGFRYNANIEYAVDAKQWLREINEYKLYETNVDVGFGDEFLTLTTCNSSRRKNGRFVVVARRVRDGETFE